MNLEFLHAEHALVFCTISRLHDSSSHHPFLGIRLKDETQGLRYARYMTLWRDPPHHHASQQVAWQLF